MIIIGRSSTQPSTLHPSIVRPFSPSAIHLSTDAISVRVSNQRPKIISECLPIRVYLSFVDLWTLRSCMAGPRTGPKLFAGASPSLLKLLQKSVHVSCFTVLRSSHGSILKMRLFSIEAARAANMSSLSLVRSTSPMTCSLKADPSLVSSILELRSRAGPPTRILELA